MHLLNPLLFEPFTALHKQPMYFSLRETSKMNGLRSIKKHLEVYEQTFANALTSESPIAAQPPHVTPPLRIHQLASLDAMREKELSLQIGYKIQEETLFSKFALLGDSVGVGKTLMVLGHVSQMATHPLKLNQVPLSNLQSDSISSCFSISPTIQRFDDTIFDSLIVVPHTIYRQWQDTITTQTTLRTHFLKTQRDLDKDTFLTSMRISHITLVSNTLFPILMNSFRVRDITPTWRRVFYDEADSIKIPSTCPFPKAYMTWYISATYKNILFANSSCHSYLLRLLSNDFLESLSPEIQESLQALITNHPNVTFYKVQSFPFFQDQLRSQHPLRGHLVVRSSQEFLDFSIQLPELHQQVIRCQTPPSYEILQSAIPPQTETLLHAGDIQGAFQSLGISTHSHQTIVEAVTEFRDRELQRLKRRLEFNREETYVSEQAKELALNKLQKKITELEQQIQGIRQRIMDASPSLCAICFDTPSNSIVTPCCAKLFCGDCILHWLMHRVQCPLCRESIHPSQLKNLGNPTGQPTTSRSPPIPQKMEALLQILEENPEGRFLIFSRFDSPLQSIHEQISNNYPSHTLQGNKDSIAKTLAEFEKGNIRILLMNSQTSAAGLNIPSATHLILLHKMGVEEEKQILGRAYRLGRTRPLHFIKLLHHHE